jgi:CubicO group peptidase (beta-lactamase class C family)
LVAFHTPIEPRVMRGCQLAAIAVTVVLMVACTNHEDQDAEAEIADDNAVIDAIFASWDLPGSPGCALAVAQDGVLQYSRGYGYANLDYDIPITPQTVFDVASVTKQFNAASITMLASDGTLSLDDDVRQWLPELPEYDSTVTLQHMMYHTSGLRDYLTLFPLAGRNDYYPISHARILAMMSRQRAVVAPPGVEYRYSNTAYMLLAQVIERAGGQTLGEITSERIFEPLGMASSRMYEDLEEIIPRRATGYDHDENGHVRVVHNYNFDVAGDGQLYTTMEDLLRWDNYLHGKDKAAIHTQMLTEGYLNNGDPIAYAQGLRLDQYRGLQRVGHGGSSWGFRTELVRYLEAGLSIAISCNVNSANPQKLAKEVADHYLADQLEPRVVIDASGAELQDVAEVIAPPVLTVDQLVEYSGSFFSPELDATYRFTVFNGELVLRIEQESPLTVTPVGNDRFVISFHPAGWTEPMPVSLVFDRNRAAVITGFGLSAGSERGIVFEQR